MIDPVANVERSRKRLKLDPDLKDDSTPLPSYVRIAYASFTLETISPEFCAQPDTNVTVREVELIDGACTAVFVLVGSATTLVATLKNEPGVNFHVLFDCVKLQSGGSRNRPEPHSPATSSTTLHFDHQHAFLDVEIFWPNSNGPRDATNHAVQDLLWRYQPCGRLAPNKSAEPWDVREFYDNVHIPPGPADDGKDNLKIDLLKCQLYPFQERAAQWLLQREGVKSLLSGQVVAAVEDHDTSESLPFDFTSSTDADGRPIFISPALNVVSSSRNLVDAKYSNVRGGILAEAMGLGKTVEMIALICLHTRERTALTVPDPPGLVTSGATLIITPPTILEQWKSEIQEHAPSLRVYHYEGITSIVKRKAISLDLIAGYDVVLTTYNVISKEVHYVKEKPNRNLRNRPRAEPPKSPLTQIQWWRCLLDEAQMIESGVSNAATVARLIPRVNAWAVTGTPLKQSHRDLYGLLLFLRQEPWTYSPRLWDYLVYYHRPLFRKMINNITIRHSKESVRDELRLPTQNRHTITMPFTAIEESHYAQMHSDMQHDCELDNSGAPLDDQWDPDDPAIVEKMRTWLIRLRQTCLHPEVGGRNRKALGRSGGPLRTVQQVLSVMIEQADGGAHTEQRNVLMSELRRGQMLENAKRTAEAMEVYKNAHNRASQVVGEARKALEAEILRQNEAKSKRDAETKDEGLEENNEDEDEEKDEQDAVLSARQRLRSALEVYHICVFFTANIFFQLKSDVEKVEPDSDEFADLERQETSAYEEAKAVRTELLAEVLRKANRLITTIRSKYDGVKSSFVMIREMEFSLDDFGGIESRKVFDKLHTYCELMNDQANQFQQTRERMVAMLRQGLLDEDESIELQGDEYEASTKHQDEMYVVMEILRALFADRSDAITGQENLLIRQEMKQFLRNAKEGEGPAPELMLKMLAERDKGRINTAEQGSLKGLLTEIRALAGALEWQEAASSRARAELSIVNQLLQHAQELNVTQAKIMSSLEQEVNLIRDTMNARLDYYRALQVISDAVAPFEEEKVGQPINAAAYEKLLREETVLNKKLSTLLSKRRYLLHLKNESSSTTPRLCTICQCDFEIGTLTVCGHQFCKECIQIWYAEHRNCPICKRRLQAADFYDITYKPASVMVEAEPQQTEDNAQTETSTRPVGVIYSDISTDRLNAIKNVEIRGASFGSKVDTICRQLRWLRDHDPGSKAIIFSQYRDFLDVLGRALRQNGIIYSKFDDKDGIQEFKSNPAHDCFLLHAKAYSAGLNLVVANHVILCEPLINTAIELQAIARVHRIGQHRATTVWMYLVADTVEESIYEISVKRRLAHISHKDGTRSGSLTPALQETDLEAADSKELQAADLSKMFIAGRSGGELVDKEDLWPCLFGKIRDRPGFWKSAADMAPANGEIGRFLRAEAANDRRGS